MAGKRSLTSLHLKSLLDENDMESLLKKLEPKHEPPVKPYFPNSKVTEHRTNKLWKAIGSPAQPDILDPWTSEHLEGFDGNIEIFHRHGKTPYRHRWTTSSEWTLCPRRLSASPRNIRGGACGELPSWCLYDFRSGRLHIDDDLSGTPSFPY
jgi:hypothetical protein